MSGSELFELLAAARKALHHAAHVYAKTKDPVRRGEAAVALDRAALTMVLAAGQWGLHADCAAPAGTAGDAWKQHIKDTMIAPPESAKKRRK
jgi:hypothetical protein